MASSSGPYASVRQERKATKQRPSGRTNAAAAPTTDPPPAVGFVLHPDDKDPYVFRIDSPISLQKQPATKHPRLWATGAVGALGVAATATAVRRRRG